MSTSHFHSQLWNFAVYDLRFLWGKDVIFWVLFFHVFCKRTSSMPYWAGKRIQAFFLCRRSFGCDYGTTLCYFECSMPCQLLTLIYAVFKALIWSYIYMHWIGVTHTSTYYILYTWQYLQVGHWWWHLENADCVYSSVSVPLLISGPVELIV